MRKILSLLFVFLFTALAGFAQTSTGGGQSGNGSNGSANQSSANLIDPTQATYGVKYSGGHIGADGSTTNNNNNFSSASTNCSTSDIGKAISVVNSVSGAFAVPTATVTTITGCNGNAWVMSANATATISGTAYWGIVWDAGPGLAAAYAAAFPGTLTGGQILALPCGTMGLSVPPFISPAYAPYLQRPDIQGCNATSGTTFVLLPTITKNLTSGVQPVFAGASNSGLSGGIGVSGSNVNTKIDNLYITSLNGLLPNTGASSYILINNYNMAFNITMQLIGQGGGTWYAFNSGGESDYRRLNLQNFNGAFVGVNASGQGIMGVSDSVFAFAGMQPPLICAGSDYCVFSNNYIVQTTGGIETVNSNDFVTVIGSEISCNEGAAIFGCLYDDSNASTWYIFGNPLIQQTTATWYALYAGNGSTSFDISGSNIASVTSGYNVGGIGNLNDRAGVTWSSPLTQFTGVYNPIGGGSMALTPKIAATNFGTAIGTTNLVASVIATAPMEIYVGLRQITLGVGCGAGTNTAQVTITYTSPGGTTGVTQTSTTLSISANGTIDTGDTAGQQFSFTPKVGTAVTYSVASVLGSTGCSTTPQYATDLRVL